MTEHREGHPASVASPCWADADVPTCGTSPAARVRWALHELRTIVQERRTQRLLADGDGEDRAGGLAVHGPPQVCGRRRGASRRVKELMALAIAVVKQCDGCIAYHAKAAARRGATAEEVAEALSIALLMDGGTATVYGPRAWQAYQEFAPSVVSPPGGAAHN